jgi:hypothetical protein
MYRLSFLLVLCTIAVRIHISLSRIYLFICVQVSHSWSVNPCASCFRKNTTLPIHVITGDNYCRVNQTNENILIALYKYALVLFSFPLLLLLHYCYFVTSALILFMFSLHVYFLYIYLFSSALGGSGWYNNLNWLSGDYCSWYGISCDQNRAVVTMYVFLSLSPLLS